MLRRDFLVRTGWAVGAGALASGLASAKPITDSLPPLALDDWESVRRQFDLTRQRIHMSGFFLSSHPHPVREAIERHRRGLDENPYEYAWSTWQQAEADTLRAASEYFGASPTDIALTDSTTMGLGLLYGGLKVRTGQEILTTTHDHYSTATALRLRAERTGATVKRIPLYRDLSTVSEDEVVDTLMKAVKPQTRAVAVTWVHSSTGLKLPIRRMAEALQKANAGRPEESRVLLCVDGVHGFGVEDATMEGLGCDFFVAGCHKWLFGPRGTGLVCGTPRGWAAAQATIPTFDHDAYQIWMEEIPPKKIPIAAAMTPGGFHSFEHRWALSEAFRFHQQLGKARVERRIHDLNLQLKEGLAAMKHVRLHTPMVEGLSAGIVCFEVQGMTPVRVVKRLLERRIIASETPYATRYARLAPSLLNSPEEVETTLREIRALA